jgi:hypothetical protein
MRFRNDFEVPLPPEQAWAVLLDIPRIAPCMPGASLTQQVDDRTYKGNVEVRLGPVALKFAGTAVFEEIDPVVRTARVKAAGTDAKGRGGANSLVSFAVTPSEAGSHVIVDTDLSLSGAVAQYGRGAGMIQAIAAQLIGQFAGTLREQLKAAHQDARVGPAALPRVEPATVESARPVPATDDIATPYPLPRPLPASPPVKPISGLSLLMRVLYQALLRVFGRRSET